MDLINLSFQGYWREVNKGGIPSESGIYCVYRCTFDGKYVNIKELLYIGESFDTRDRIEGHERYYDWTRHLRTGEVLCYSFAPKSVNRERAEAALIFNHKPVVNSEYKNSFPYPDTKIKTSGSNAGIYDEFIVRDTRESRGLNY